MVIVSATNVAAHYPNLSLPAHLLFPCPLDGIWMYAPIPPKGISGSKISDPDDDKVYTLWAQFPWGWVRWSPKPNFSVPEARLWINPSRNRLSRQMLLSEVAKLFPNPKLLVVASFDGKIDLLGWPKDQTEKAIWAKRRRRITKHLTTTYYGRPHKNGEVKTYNKAEKLKLNLSVPLTRVEVARALKAGKRPTLPDFLRDPLAYGNPFDSVSLVDVSSFNGQRRYFRRVKREGIQKALTAKDLSKVDKEKIRNAAKQAEILSLRDEYAQLVNAWV